jgi:hypothetical protein
MRLSHRNNRRRRRTPGPREKRVRRNISQIVSLLREEKHFWIQELDGVANEFPYRRVLDIFVRVNSGGTKLDASDLMFAAMKEGWAEIEEVIEETTELLNGTNLKFDKTFPLKCLLLAHGRGAEASPEKFTGTDGEKLLLEMNDGWDRAEAAFQQLRDFMQHDLKVYADKVVRSYNSFIPLFDYLYHNPKPNETDRALRHLSIQDQSCRRAPHSWLSRLAACAASRLARFLRSPSWFAGRDASARRCSNPSIRSSQCRCISINWPRCRGGTLAQTF